MEDRLTTVWKEFAREVNGEFISEKDDNQIHNYEGYTVKYIRNVYEVTVSTYFQGIPEQGKGVPVRYTRVRMELKQNLGMKLKVRMKDWVSRLAAIFEGGTLHPNGGRSFPSYYRCITFAIIFISIYIIVLGNLAIKIQEIKK